MKFGKLEKPEVLTITGSVISFLLFSIFLQNMSVPKLVRLQTKVLGNILISTQGMGLGKTIFTILSPFVNIFIGLLFLTLGFVFLAVYGVKKPKQIGLITGIITSVIMLFAFSFSLLSIFMAINFVICCAFIVSLSNTYYKELKKWKNFRLGSRSLSTILIIFNLILALGIFTEVYVNSNTYKQNFKNGLTETLTEITVSSISNSQPQNVQGMDQETIKEMTKNKVGQTLESSLLIESSLRLLPLITALLVWVILEFLKNLVLSNIGGLFSFSMLKLKE